MMSFPILLAVSACGSVAGSLATAPQAMDELHDFYVRTRPWGWWRPVVETARRRNGAFQPNRNFVRDMFNVLVGVVWQTAFVVLPIYIVIRDWRAAAVTAAVILLTSFVLKVSWYDRLLAADDAGEVGADSRGRIEPVRS